MSNLQGARFEFKLRSIEDGAVLKVFGMSKEASRNFLGRVTEHDFCLPCNDKVAILLHDISYMFDLILIPQSQIRRESHSV
jgi:hypothetical protein